MTLRMLILTYALKTGKYQLSKLTDQQKYLLSNLIYWKVSIKLTTSVSKILNGLIILIPMTASRTNWDSECSLPIKTILASISLLKGTLNLYLNKHSCHLGYYKYFQLWLHCKEKIMINKVIYLQYSLHKEHLLLFRLEKLLKLNVLLW